MKPWRPYWKCIERCIDELETNSEFSGIGDSETVSDWIQNLTYAELWDGDLCVGELIRWLEDPSEKHRRFFFPIESAKLPYQLYLRCIMALDFCRGNHPGRKHLNWEKPNLQVYRSLLVELWRREAESGYFRYVNAVEERSSFLPHD